MERVTTALIVLLTLTGVSAQAHPSDVLHPLLVNRITGAKDSIAVVIFFDPSASSTGLINRASAKPSTPAAEHTFARTLAQSKNQYLDEAVSSLSRSHQVRSFWITSAMAVKVSPDELEQIAEYPGVVKIVPDVQLSLVDPVSSAPAPAAVSTSVATELSLLGVPSVWSQGITGKGSLVCSFDTGVKWDHPALEGKWRGQTASLHSSWFSPLSPDSLPFDLAGHGTHTMGIMVGSTPTDSFGVAPGAQWINAAVIDQGKSLSATISDILAAFQWALNPDGDWSTSDDVPDVILNSWGIPAGLFGPCDNTFWNAIDNVEAAGIVTIFAAGNEGPNPTTVRSPADRGTTPTNSLAVGAIDANRVIANFSSRGPSNCSGAIKPDVVAPGVMIRSSFKDGGYLYMSGTSMAAPFIAGLVALGRQANPNATVEQIKQSLLDACDDLGPAGDDNAYGNGLVNAPRFIDILRLLKSRSVELVESSLADTLLLPGATAQLSLDVRTFSPEDILQARIISAQSGIQSITTGLVSLSQSPTPGLYHSLEPLVFSVSPDLPHGSTLSVGVEISDADGIRDTISLALAIGYVFDGSSVEVSANSLSLNVSDFGRLGMASGSSFNRNGSGLKLGDSNNLLYEGALAVASDGLLISATRDSLGHVGLPGFSVESPLSDTTPEQSVARHLRAVMHPRSGQLPIRIRQDVRTPSASGLNAIAFRFVLTNVSDSALNNAALGLVFDIDFDGGEIPIGLSNRSFALQGGSGASIGIAPIRSTTGVEIVASPTDKHGWVSAALDSLLMPTDSSLSSGLRDLLFIVHSGQTELKAGDSLILEFVIFGNQGEELLESTSEAARKWGAHLITSGPGEVIPSSFELAQNYPNPFNPTTTVRFGLAEAGSVTISIYNSLGQEVSRLADRAPYPAGIHEIIWNAQGDRGEMLGSGIYFLKVTVGANSLSRKMVLVK